MSCALTHEAIKVARAYDYKINCNSTDACRIAVAYFAQKFIDLGVECSSLAKLQAHVDCQSFPAVIVPSVTVVNCPITITEAEGAICRPITISVVQ